MNSHWESPPLRTVRCLTIAGCLLALCAAAADAPQPWQPAIEAEPAGDGGLTWWLCSPTLKEADIAKPPKDARQGQPLAEGSPHAWSLHISPLPFVDLKPLLTARGGSVWAAARVNSLTGGPRRLRGYSYCGLRVFRDGELVLDKPQPAAPFADELEAKIEFPKGVCELVVCVTVRSGFCGFQLSVTEAALKGGSRPAAGDRLLVPTTPGQEADCSAAALAALRFESKDMFVNPQQTIGVAAAMHGSQPVGLGPLTPRFVDPNGKEFGKPMPARTAAELARSPWHAEYAVPADIGFTHEIGLEVKAGEKLLGTRKLTLFSLRGLNDAAQAMEAELAQRSAKCGHALPNAALAIEKLRLFLTKIESGEERVTRELGKNMLALLATAKSCAEAEERGADPYEGKTGYLERAYHSRIDEAPQPYYVYVPAHLATEEARKQRHPLVVFLHGYVPVYDKHRWWEEMPEFNAVFERNNCLLLIPFGRSNADFQGSGEVDVLDAIAEAKRLYPVDDERVYLYGYSMGGMGVYTVGAHYSDQFAAGIVFSGRADSPLQNLKPMENFHPFKQWLIHADNPISLCENFTSLPLRIFHGRDDFIINTREASRMEKRFATLSCDAKLTVMPGAHFFGFEVMATDEPVKWLLEQKRALQPAKGRIKSYSLRYAKAGDVQVTAAEGGQEPIELEWTNAAGKIEIVRESKNILQRGIKDKLTPEKLDGLHKTPRLCGPVREATCGPFTIVYGTSGTPEANARNKKNAEQFAGEWYAFSKSRAVLKADKDVSDTEKKGKNLFLFGEEQENLLHAEGAKQLPFAVKDGHLTMGPDKYPLAGRGIVYIYPSPFADAGKACSVVVCAGLHYGRDVAPNHKLDLLPDFLLFDDKKDTDSTDTSRPIVAGFFDARWKVDPKTIWRFDK